MQHPRKVHVAILDCDNPVPKVREVYGEYYSSRFIQLLDQAAQRSKSTTKLEFSVWNAMQFEYPRQEDVDAILVPGSIKSAYDKDPWILKLIEFVHDTYDKYPRIKIFGACFGHQIVGQAVLASYGAVAAKDPKGYELGVQTVTFNPEFATHFDDILVSRAERPAQLTMQFIHGDHLDMEGVSLPKPWMNVGSTQHCRVQGLYNPGRVFTLQGHCEFNEYISYESIKYFFTPGRGWSEEATEAALKSTQKPDQGERAVDIVYAFLAGDAVPDARPSSHADDGIARVRSGPKL